MAGYKQLFPLPVKTPAAGGNSVVELEGIAGLDARVAGFMFELTGTGTTGSSTQAVTPKSLSGLLANIDLDSDWFNVRATGRLLHHLHKVMYGASLGQGETVTCTTGGVAARGYYSLPCIDERSLNPFDGAVPCKLFSGKTISINYAASLTLDLTVDVVMSALSLRPYAVLVPSSGPKLPMRSMIRYEDFAAATANIQKTGYMPHLFCYSDSAEGATAAGVVTAAQYAQFTLQAGGQTLLDRVLTQHLLAQFGSRMIRDSGQLMSYQDSVNLDFIPLLFPTNSWKALQQPRTGGTVTIDTDSGTATAWRYAYRMLLDTDPALEAEGARIMGYDPAQHSVQASTASKAGLEGSASRVNRAHRILPKRIVRA